MTTNYISFPIDYDGPQQSYTIYPGWYGLSGGLAYHFYATVVNDIGEGEGSNEVVMELLLPPDPPVQESTDWDADSVTISWGGPVHDGGMPLLGYRLSRYHVDEVDYYSTSLWMNVTLGPEVTSYHDTGLPPGVRVSYLLSAFNSLGESGMIGFDAKPSSPYPVRDLQLINGDGYVLLSWKEPHSDGGSPVQGYRLSWFDNTDMSSGVANLPATQTSYNHTATNGRTYTYGIRAFNQIGGDGPDYIGAPFGQPRKMPGLIGGLQARWSANDTGQPFVVLSWTPLPVELAYCTIEIIKSGGMFAKAYLSATGDQSSCVDNMVMGNETYYYHIRIREGDMVGPSTAAVCILLVPGRGFVNISWAAPAVLPEDFAGYIIYRADGNGTLAAIAHLPASASGYNDTAVATGRYYTYSLAVDGTASGNTSAPTRVKVGGLLATSEPSPAGLTWPLLVILVIALVICLALWIYAPWKKLRKAVASFLVIAVAVAIVVAGAIMPVPTQSSQTESVEGIYHPGDYFIFGMYAPNGKGTVTATLLRVGDTTMTWNFTHELPGMETVSSVETMPKNNTVAFATNLMNMTMFGFLSVASVENETLATQWGYITVEHRHLNATMFGMDITMDIWSSREGLIRIDYGFSMFMVEMEMTLVKLIDTNIPAMIGGVG
jgi:hypothetical protein